MLAVSIGLAVLAALPSIWPYTFGFLHPLRVDTDPENMLSRDEPVRVFHDRMEKVFNLHDMVVVGIVNETDENGVFNPDSLHRVYGLTRYAETLRWPDPDRPGERAGIVRADLIAPSAVDNVESAGQGVVRFEWLMSSPPLNRQGALAVRDKAKRLPFLDGTLLSEDGRALALYLPLSSKDLSHQVYSSIKERLPRIWQWGPLHRGLRMHEGLQAHPEALNTAQQLGRLAAFHASDTGSFRELMRGMARKLARGEGGSGWSQVRQAAGQWEDEARELRSAHRQRVEETRKEEGELRGWRLRIQLAGETNRAFRQHLAERAREAPDGSWLPFARLYAASLQNRTLDAVELVREVEKFAERMQKGLSGAPAMQDLQRTARASLDRHQGFPGEDGFHITGLPVAEDTFGVLMFKQMAISAPLAMLVIFLLLLYFFRKLALIIAPMIVAMVSVVCAMGLLIATGNTVHIMSSMIPIFIMPIAVLDSVHILSEFFDRYREHGNRRDAMVHVMDALFQPMLFTSLTTAAGFASLALTPIPPVQVFGLFVAFGVMMAWLWTITFIPAYVMFIPERRLAGFGRTPGGDESGRASPLDRFLRWLGRTTYARAKLIVVLVAAVLCVSAYGISLIEVNDNPVKWFTSSHPIRVADRVLNDHFGGTYMAYLSLLPPEDGGETAKDYVGGLRSRLQQQGEKLSGEMKRAPAVFAGVAEQAEVLAGEGMSKEELLRELESYAETRRNEATFPASYVWGEVLSFIDRERQSDQLFKQPEVLRYIEGLEEHLTSTEAVGKSNSLADIVKTVHRELLGSQEAYRIPDTPQGVAQCLITYQNSHRPQDLWHFTTTDYRKGCLWLQLTSGDNKDMSRVVREVEAYTDKHPPPMELEPEWFGLTYINVKWQEKMVHGMLKAFLGSFLVVLFMMSLLFRSSLWGMLCMIPLTVTIALIYGAIGLAGKAYDMPVAVLSSLSLGLAVDYAIHFLARSRQMQERYGDWNRAVEHVFGEPARAIARNVIVIGVGFLPLLAAPLIPYKTVGALIASILLTAGLASLLILPAAVRLLEQWLFPSTRTREVTCQCGTCIVTAGAAIAIVAVSMQQFTAAGWTELTWYSVAALAALALGCLLMSKRQRCRVAAE
jgi:hypothetical protein